MITMTTLCQGHFRQLKSKFPFEVFLDKVFTFLYINSFNYQLKSLHNPFILVFIFIKNVIFLNPQRLYFLSFNKNLVLFKHFESKNLNQSSFVITKAKPISNKKLRLLNPH
jgi:hypothetical protein